MKRENVFLVALWVSMAAVFVLFYKMIAPLFAPIVWAVVLVVTWYPLHRLLAKRVRSRGIAAVLSTFAVAIIILGPAIYTATLLVGEAGGMLDHFKTGSASSTIDELATRFDPMIRSLEERLSGIVDLSDWSFRGIVTQAAGKLNEWAGKYAAAIFANIGKVTLQFFMMLVTIYYLFKDAATFKDRVKEAIPLSAERSDTLMKHVTNVVRSAIFGGLVVAAIQGAIGGLLFFVLGLPSPILWGVVMAFFALIPIIGPFVVYIPAAFVLMAGGSYVKATILLVLGIGIVSQIDNVLRPLIISGRTQIHPLLLFIAILGGVSAFGFVGIIAGPVLAALLVAIYEVYRLEMQDPPRKA